MGPEGATIGDGDEEDEQEDDADDAEDEDQEEEEEEAHPGKAAGGGLRGRLPQVRTPPLSLAVWCQFNYQQRLPKGEEPVQHHVPEHGLAVDAERSLDV